MNERMCKLITGIVTCTALNMNQSAQCENVQKYLYLISPYDIKPMGNTRLCAGLCQFCRISSNSTAAKNITAISTATKSTESCIKLKMQEVYHGTFLTPDHVKVQLVRHCHVRETQHFTAFLHPATTTSTTSTSQGSTVMCPHRSKMSESVLENLMFLRCNMQR